MFANTSLGRWFGIPVYIHWTFWLLPLWVILAQPGGLPVAFYLLVVFAMFGCVVLHEFGHALAARGFGIGTRDVTLYPIGGVASLKRMSERAGEEFVIAIAGPLVNVAIASVLGLSLAAGAAWAPGLLGDGLLMFVQALIILNIIMVIFNLVPAFPLDGGRILRAALASFLPRLKATRVAVTIGSMLAMLMVAAGIMAALEITQYGSPMLIFIGLFVYLAGQQELRFLEYRERARQLDQFYDPAPPHEELPTWPQPRVNVYVFDPQTGRWVREDADQYTRA
jgi:Zn-dependent protease